MIRLLIVDESRLMGSVIATALDRQPDIHVSGCVAALREALDRVCEADIVLMSMAPPRLDALDWTRRIVAAHPAARVLCVGVPDSEEVIVQCIEAGGAGYVLHDASVDTLVESIRAAHTGQAIISPDIAALLMIHYARLAVWGRERKLLQQR